MNRETKEKNGRWPMDNNTQHIHTHTQKKGHGYTDSQDSLHLTVAPCFGRVYIGSSGGNPSMGLS
ncbi:hypothetical protein B0O80DRAFT_452880 [Mortierella sp. GBAus27b]|nr:hypothetical protein B0O80DRAFT_452880 [Mortierella sp. GBAus27b]